MYMYLMFVSSCSPESRSHPLWLVQGLTPPSKRGSKAAWVLKNCCAVDVKCFYETWLCHGWAIRFVRMLPLAPLCGSFGAMQGLIVPPWPPCCWRRCFVLLSCPQEPATQHIYIYIYICFIWKHIVHQEQTKKQLVFQSRTLIKCHMPITN